MGFSIFTQDSIPTMNYLLLALGGALGTLLRFFLTNATYEYLKTPAFPFGTLAVNLAGSFVIGLLAGYNDLSPYSTGLRMFLFVGLLGGFTTFSSFSLETLNLFRNSMPGYALLNILASNIGGLALAAAGFFLAKR